MDSNSYTNIRKSDVLHNLHLKDTLVLCGFMIKKTKQYRIVLAQVFLFYVCLYTIIVCKLDVVTSTDHTILGN